MTKLKKIPIHIISILIVTTIVCTMLPVSVFAESASNVTETAYYKFWPYTDYYNIISRSTSETGYGTVSLTAENPTATDYVGTRFYSSYGTSYPTKYEWPIIWIDDEDVVSVTTKTVDSMVDAPYGNEKALQVDFVGGNKSGTTTVTIEFTTYSKVVPTELFSGETLYCNSTIVYTVSNEVAPAEKAYTISYDADGGTGAPDTQILTYNTGSAAIFTIPYTTPTKDGYVFENWTVNGTIYNPGACIIITADTTLTAVWKKIPHEHIDDDNDGYCDDDNTCMHEKDENGHCTIEGCLHSHEGEGSCCLLKPTPPVVPENPQPLQKPNLPQTGQFWWPVAILLIVGVILLLLGRRKNKRMTNE